MRENYKLAKEDRNLRHLSYTVMGRIEVSAEEALAAEEKQFMNIEAARAHW